MRRLLIFAACCLLGSSLAWAQRSKRPANFTNLSDPNQLTELNNTLSDFWHITNGRYTLENITTNPNGTRQGIQGDLVYAQFGGSDHLCLNTSKPASTAWTCINVDTLETCPGGFDTQVQFNDNGACGGDAGAVYEKNANRMGLGGEAISPSATLELDSTDVTAIVVETPQFVSDNQIFYMPIGTTLSAQRQNQFLAPTLNGVAGGAAETVTDSATVYINGPPTGSDITLDVSTSTDREGPFSLWVDSGSIRLDGGVVFGDISGTGSHSIIIPGIDGTESSDSFTILIDSFNGSGSGGNITLEAGSSGTTSTSNGGDAYIIAGDGGGDEGSGGDIFLDAGETENGSTNDVGGTIYIIPGSAGASSTNGSGGDVIVQLGRNTGTGLGTSVAGKFQVSHDLTITNLPTELTNIHSIQNNTTSMLSGATIANERFNIFEAPVINGVAGGATETITSAATVYIAAATSGSNITFTNGPYALWVDAGTTRFDAIVSMQDDAEVTGEVVTWSTITSNRTSDLGWSIVTGVDTACTTTCTSACVHGQDTSAVPYPMVSCTDATADRCLCAGAN